MLDPENQSMKDIILKSKLCTADQMNEVIEEHTRTGKSLKDILIDFQITTESKILSIIGSEMGMECVDLNGYSIPDNVAALLESDTVRSLGVVPINFDGYTVTAATRNPLNFQVADELHFVLDKPVTVVLALEAEIDALIEKYYPMNVESL